jgi:hypothetical protein
MALYEEFLLMLMLLNRVTPAVVFFLWSLWVVSRPLVRTVRTHVSDANNIIGRFEANLSRVRGHERC